MKWFKSFFLVLSFISSALFGQTGIFTASTDIGSVKIPGKTIYDAENDQFTISASGANIWGTSDEFHFAWMKLSGDFILYTRLEFPEAGGNAHRKAGIMFRESLDPSSPYADVVLHGDGLTSLQYRPLMGAETSEIKSIQQHFTILQLRRQGTTIVASAAHDEEPLQEIGRIDMGEKGKDFYAGIFVCSHDPERTEKAVFSNVRLTIPAPEGFVPYRDFIGSRLEIMDVRTGRRKVIYESEVPFEAPNWTKDGKFLIFNQKGLLMKVPVEGGNPVELNTGSARFNNNDHGISFDGKWLAISNMPPEKDGRSHVYVLPVSGGEPKLVTENGPSYWHGWAPDGKSVVFVGERNGEFDIYSIPVSGGKETRLTTARGLDDGPEYTPDGKYIWFNSNRTGTMELYRMKPDGSAQEQMTFDEWNDWFPHVSPDGKWIVWVSFPVTVPSGDHPYYKDVMIRMMPANGGAPRVLTHLYGGQGTMNVPSWSPDSRFIAFVSNSIFNAKER